MADTAPSTSASARTVELLYRFIAPAAVIFFVATVFTDWAYARTGTLQYSNASAWMLLFGLISAGMVIALVGLSIMGGWLKGLALWGGFGLFVAGFVVEVVNFMVHNRDGYTTVVPTGFILTVIGAILILAAAWFSRTPLALNEER